MSSFNQYVVTNIIFIPKKNNIVRRAAPIRDFIAAALYPEEGESEGTEEEEEKEEEE